MNSDLVSIRVGAGSPSNLSAAAAGATPPTKGWTETEPPGGGLVGGDEIRTGTRNILTAVIAVCTGMSLADLRELTGWTGDQLNAGHSQTDITAHLLDGVQPAPGTPGIPGFPPGAELSADGLRIHLALQMAEPLTTRRHLNRDEVAGSAAVAPDASPDPLAARRDQVRIRVPHSVLVLDEAALQLWVVLASISGTGDRGGRSIDAAFISDRAGWNTRPAAAERRVERAAKALKSAGAVRIHRLQISGSRTRPVYELIWKPAGRSLDREHFEAVTLGVVRRLSPALLKCHLHLLQLMGHQRRTRLGWTELAGRRSISERTLRRQVADLSAAGLISVETGPHQLRLLEQPISIVDIEPGPDSPPEPGPQPTLSDSIERSLLEAHQRAEQRRNTDESDRPEPVDKSADKSVNVGRDGQKCRPLDIHTKIYIPRWVRQHPSLGSVAARDDEPAAPGAPSSAAAAWVPMKAAAPPAEEPSPTLPIHDPTSHDQANPAPEDTHPTATELSHQVADHTGPATTVEGRPGPNGRVVAVPRRPPPHPRTGPLSPESYRRLIAATPWLARSSDRVRGQAAALLAAALDSGDSLPALEAGLDLISDDHDQAGWIRPGVPEHEQVTGLECSRVRQAITSVKTSRQTGMCPCCRAELRAGNAHAASCPDPSLTVTAAAPKPALGWRSAAIPQTPNTADHDEPDQAWADPPGPALPQTPPIQPRPPGDIAAIVDCLQRYIDGAGQPPQQTLTLALHRLKSQTAPTDHDLIDWAGYWLLDRIDRQERVQPTGDRRTPGQTGPVASEQKGGPDDGSRSTVQVPDWKSEPGREFDRASAGYNTRQARATSTPADQHAPTTPRQRQLTRRRMPRPAVLPASAGKGLADTFALPVPTVAVAATGPAFLPTSAIPRRRPANDRAGPPNRTGPPAATSGGHRQRTHPALGLSLAVAGANPPSRVSRPPVPDPPGGGGTVGAPHQGPVQPGCSGKTCQVLSAALVSTRPRAPPSTAIAAQPTQPDPLCLYPCGTTSIMLALTCRNTRKGG